MRCKVFIFYKRNLFTNKSFEKNSNKKQHKNTATASFLAVQHEETSSPSHTKYDILWLMVRFMTGMEPAIF